MGEFRVAFDLSATTRVREKTRLAHMHGQQLNHMRQAGQDVLLACENDLLRDGMLTSQNRCKQLQSRQKNVK